MIFHPLRGFWFCVLLIAIHTTPTGDLFAKSCFVNEPHRGGIFIGKFSPNPQEPRRACPELGEGGEIILLRKIEPAHPK